MSDLYAASQVATVGAFIYRPTTQVISYCFFSQSTTKVSYLQIISTFGLCLWFNIIQLSFLLLLLVNNLVFILDF